MKAVLLPHAPTTLPSALTVGIVHNASLNAGTLQHAVSQLTAALVNSAPIDCFIGSSTTPALYWFAAKHCQPQAQLLCSQDTAEWVNLNDGAVVTFNSEPPANVNQAAPETTNATQPAATIAAEQPEPQKPQQATLPKQLLDNIFRFFVWGKEEAERLLLQAKEQYASQPEALQLLDKVARQGKHAIMLEAGLKKLWQSGADASEIEHWLGKQQQQSGRIKAHLAITAKKLREEQQKQNQKWRANKGYKLSLPHYQLNNNLHHQNLRALSPSPHWQLIVDETGTEFNQQALELNQTAQELGRIVALALPQNANLPPLEKPFHAKDEPLEKIEPLVARLLESNSGIFGSTVQDISTYSWIGAIQQHIRWALLMLPIQGPTRVQAFIEQRAPYTDSTQLQALCDSLENELKLLAPERFAQLHLTLEIMQKDHPFNGYVDTIANLWGSPSQEKRKLLARTLWRDQCLLQNTALDNIERFYHKVSYQDQLAAADWFQLCNLLSSEPEHSFLQYLSQQQLTATKANPSQWQQYLQEVHYRVSSKNFTPAGLKQALDWLALAAGEYALPKTLQLQHLSLQQAAANHFGACEPQKMQHTLQLATALRDEIPAQACEALLRVAITATHAYDFNSAIPFLQDWLAQPIAVPGLLNHAKLHSTMGQLAAFKGDYTAAEHSFSAAIAGFGKLSDPVQAEKEITQTQTYQAISWLDHAQPKADEAILSLLALGPQLETGKAFTALARSGNSERFRHYLLLRYLLARPELTEARQAYLQAEPNWQTDSAHPWMLINAYRAWLLVSSGNSSLATGYLQQAIDDCEAAGSTLLIWMGQVLATLGQSLGLNCALDKQPNWPAYLPTNKLAALSNAKDDQGRLQALNQLLPFNFH